MTLNLTWRIQLLQVLLLLLRQFLAPRAQGILYALHAAEPNDRASDPLERPRQRNLTHGPSLLLRQLLNTLDRLLCLWARVRRISGGSSRSRGVATYGVRTRQHTLCKRAPRTQRDPRLAAELNHFALLLAVQQRVVALHGDELGPAVLLGHKLHLRELVRPHARGADVANLARLDEVVQSAHRLFDRSGVVEAVNPEEIDVVGAKALKGVVDSADEGAAGEA